jgi:hypothetical protein
MAVAAVTAFSKPNTVKAQVQFTDTTVAHSSKAYPSPWQKIDERAKLENPADGNSVRALVDEIFKYPHAFGEIPPVMDTIVKERLTLAEMNYRLGRSPGVELNGVVRLVNMLADKFQLPDYARATAHQAEVLCLGLETAMPALMALPSTSQAGKAVRTDSSVMSPVQATYLLLTLIDAKLLSPDYQLPPGEWEKTKYGPMMEEATKYKELKESGKLSKLETKIVLISSSSQSDEMRTALSHAISQMSLTDGLDLVDQAFAAVGIGK